MTTVQQTTVHRRVRETMRVLWAIAANDLSGWRHSPWAVATALLPPLGLGVLLWVLTLAVGRQPVALVVDGHGPRATAMADLFVGDTEAYLLQVLTRPAAERALRDQRVAAIITVPADFDDREAQGTAVVRLELNNVDVDFSDDIRRSVTRSVAAYDAPGLGGLDSDDATRSTVEPRPRNLHNPYRIAVAEHDLRKTTVGFLQYQVIPMLVLIVINVGVLGTALLCARDIEARVTKMLLLTPVSRATLVCGKLLGGVLATWALLGPLVVLGAVLRVLAPPLGHWPAVLALLAAVTVMAVGLGLLLGVGLRQSRLVTMVGLNVATCLFFLGGGFTTVAFLPEWLQTLSRLIPTSYAIEGLRQALFYPDLIGFGRDMAALCGSALIAIVAGTLALARGWRRA